MAGNRSALLQSNSVAFVSTHIPCCGPLPGHCFETSLHAICAITGMAQHLSGATSSLGMMRVSSWFNTGCTLDLYTSEHTRQHLERHHIRSFPSCATIRRCCIMRILACVAFCACFLSTHLGACDRSEGGRLFRGVIERLVAAGFRDCKTDKKAFGVVARR